MSFNSCEVDQPHWITGNFVTQYLELSMEVLISLRPSSGTLMCRQFCTLAGYQTPSCMALASYLMPSRGAHNL